MRKYKSKVLRTLLSVLLLVGILALPAAAAQTQGSTDVAGVVEQTWDDASQQIRTVVDSVVFPALSMILAVAFFGKVALCYFEYRRGGHFEWTGPVILFVCLVFVLLAPNYVWSIIGM